MDIMLIETGGPKLRFPVNPTEISVKREKKYETINILNLGEIDFPHGEKVDEVTFSSFFPREYDASYCRFPDIPDPREAVEQLGKWTHQESPVRLIISDLIDMLVLVSASSSILKGGEPEDIYFDLSMRAWRPVKVWTSALAGATSGGGANAGKAARPDLKPVPKTYTVKSGDTLYKIAKLELGDGARWKEIYSRNSAVIGKNPDLIQPGMKLVLS